ncbi:MAG: hypothetical protein PHC34_14120, partial [Candidatus Gastranaerophilales bacterium]|nr:hypothetical protein [Candidatus Gastranaerophilales bacterium]
MINQVFTQINFTDNKSLICFTSMNKKILKSPFEPVFIHIEKDLLNKIQNNLDSAGFRREDFDFLLQSLQNIKSDHYQKSFDNSVISAETSACLKNLIYVAKEFSLVKLEDGLIKLKQCYLFNMGKAYSSLSVLNSENSQKYSDLSSKYLSEHNNSLNKNIEII